MNIKIILNQPYPKGMASTQRVHLYSKGLVADGHQVQIILPVAHSYNKKLNNQKSHGIHDNIPYVYPSGKSTRSGSFVKRRIDDLIGTLNSGILIYKNRSSTDAIILISVKTFQIIFFKIIAKLSGAVFLTECNEHPFAFAGSKSFRSKKWFQKYFVEYIMSLFDGLLVISHNLVDFYKEKLDNKVKYKLIPVLVDLDEFSNKQRTQERYIAYAGNLSQDKDGIYTQLKAFAKASKIFPDLKFYIVGNAQRNVTKDKALSLISELGISEKVIFTGFVSRKKLVSIFQNANALTLYKPNSIQAEFCFPSKIAEYLASGAPVVTTSTGELNNFLKHEESAMLSPPSNEEDFAENLIKILSDDTLAANISGNGWKIAFQNFEYRKQSKEITSFIFELMQQKKGKS